MYNDRDKSPLVLNLQGVKKNFAGREVLSGIDLTLKEGECLALLGPNGAGKSTTIRIALGLSRADAGRIEVLGYEMPELGHCARASIGVVPQYDALDPDFTVMENLLVFGGFFQIDIQTLRQRSKELIEFAALGQRSMGSVGQLSGGMKRRLSLARALINQPRLLFLDEPTTALDPQAKHLIWERLLQLKRQGISLFLTTHFMDEAQRLADQVAVLDRGKIIAHGSPKELIEKHVGKMVLEVWGREAQGWLRSFQGIADRRADSPKLNNLIQAQAQARAQAQVRAEAVSSDGPAATPKEIQGIERRGESYFLQDELAESAFLDLKRMLPSDVEYLYRPGNLEDVFFRLTGRDLRDD